MQVFRSLDGYLPGPHPVVTIGTFDGVHRGHRTILARLHQQAEAVGGSSVVVSFHPHPRLVLNPTDTSLRLLHTLDEKIAALRDVGLHRLVLLPFTREFAATPSAVFIRDILVGRLRPHTVVIGYDHRFGADRGGGLDDLRAAGAIHGFAVEEIPAHQIDDANVSSTHIRQALQAGHVDHAARLLDYRYALTGTVVQGRQLGRSIGFPTANLLVADAQKLVPAAGIYAVQAVTATGAVWPGMMSIGTNPTVTDDPSLKLEVHLIGFSGDLYGQPLTVQFVQRLRDEVRYDGLAALQAQLHRDEHDALAALRNNP